VKLGAGLVLAVLTGSAHADLRIALGNDVLSEGSPPFDDDGFTHQFDLRFWRPHRGYLVGGRLYDRWITEVPRVAGGRRDLLELVATIERSWPLQLGEALGVGVTAAGRVGPSVTGNLGSRWMQSSFHGLCGCGETLEEGLQRRYDGDGGIGALLGAAARGSFGVPVAHVYGGVDAQAVLGAGVTFVDAAAGGQLAARIRGTELAAHAEVAVMRFHAADERLALPGGYGAGWQPAYRIGVHAAWSRFRVEYQYRANEGGSGEPIGVVAFTVKQAGTRF